jgi:hypothetical protein
MSRTPPTPRSEDDHRSRVLLALVALAFLHTLARFTFMADPSQPPYRWQDRAAWWLPKGW